MVRRSTAHGDVKCLFMRRTLPSEHLEDDHQRVIVRMTRGGETGGDPFRRAGACSGSFGFAWRTPLTQSVDGHLISRQHDYVFYNRPVQRPEVYRVCHRQ